MIFIVTEGAREEGKSDTFRATMKVNVNENQDCSVGLGAILFALLRVRENVCCLFSVFFFFILTGRREERSWKKITQSTGIHSFAYNDYSSRASNSKHSTLNDNNQILQWMNSHWRCACKTERVGFSSFTKNFFFHFVFFFVYLFCYSIEVACVGRERA